MANMDLLSKIPAHLTGFNAFLDRENFCGSVTKITPPKITFKTDDFQAGCMWSPSDIPMGLDKMKTEFTLQDYSATVDKRVGKRVLFSFRGAVKVDGVEVALVMDMAGLLHEIDFGNWEAQKLGEKKFSLGVDYLKYEYNGETIIEFDNFGAGLVVGGEDRGAARKAALGI